MARWLVLALILLALLGNAIAHASAQTPDDLTPTPEPTKLTEPSPTPTAVPIVAGPDEIVFTGELAVPVGTEVTANFYDISIKDISDIVCGTSATEPTEAPGISRFVLRVQVECAEDNALRGICWDRDGCIIYLVDPPYCFPPRCEWSQTVRPGAFIDLGRVPVASSDELVLTGTVPAPPGTSVTIQTLDIATVHVSTCDSAQTAPIADSGSSAFILRIQSNCSPEISFPKICWGEGECQIFFELDPRIDRFQFGTTVLTGLLSSEQFNAPPSPPSAGGQGEPILPGVGARSAREPHGWFGSTAAVVMLALLGLAAASAAVMARLRQP